MAPIRPRQSVSKEKFATFFGPLRTVAYHDPSARGSASGITTIAWNPLGTLIATGSGDRTLRVWNPEKQNVRYSTDLKGHAAALVKVAFNPVKESELCSASSDGAVRFWDARTKAVLNEIKGLGAIVSLAWAPDGESLIVGNETAELHILSPTQTRPIATHQQAVQTNQVVFCNSGNKIFLAMADGKVNILSYPDFEPVLYSSSDTTTPFALNGHTSSCQSVEIQPTGRFLATGGSDSLIALWDTTDWICQRTITDMTGPVENISFSFDGSFVVGGSGSDKIKEKEKERGPGIDSRGSAGDRGGAAGDSKAGSGLEIAHTETGEHVYTHKTAGPCPAVAWHPSRYILAYADLGSLKIIGVDPERR